jgi:hypothetical protein
MKANAANDKGEIVGWGVSSSGTRVSEMAALIQQL